FNGRVDANVTDARGTGAINLTPQFPVVLSHTTSSGPGDVTLSNPVNLNDGSTIDFRVDGGVADLVLAGKVSGSNTFYKSGSATIGQGSLVLNNSATDFTGNSVVMTGMLVAGADNALGSTAGYTMVNPGASLGIKGGINYTAAEK